MEDSMFDREDSFEDRSRSFNDTQKTVIKLNVECDPSFKIKTLKQIGSGG